MKKIFLIILTIALFYTGCDTIDFGDTNKNVNGPKEGSTAALLSGAITRYSTRTGRPYRITPTLNVQYFMQLVYNDEMLYANTPGYWSAYYSQILSNLKEVIDVCSDPVLSQELAVTENGDPANQLAVAMIFKAVIFKRVTDLFGDIPYSKALTLETFTPAYDKQEDIYASMIADVKEARDMIKTDAAGPVGDVIYDGDMIKWQKFANSFLMSLSLQLTEAGSSKIDPEAVFVEALGDGSLVIETLDEEAWYTYDIDNGFDNPWNWMRPADYGVTLELISSMKGDGDNKVTSNTTFDERLLFVVEDTSIIGLPYGYYEYVDEHSPANPILLDATTSLPMLTAAYTFLHRAEAAARGWTTEDANEMLTSAIMASYASFSALYNDGTVAMSDGSAYAAARVADIATAPGGALQVIAEEKWVSLFPLGYDAWSEWRRTDYPTLTPAPDAINDGQIARRYNYPSDESTLNSSGYSTGVSGLTPATDNNTSRVWWDK